MAPCFFAKSGKTFRAHSRSALPKMPVPPHSSFHRRISASAVPSNHTIVDARAFLTIALADSGRRRTSNSRSAICASVDARLIPYLHVRLRRCMGNRCSNSFPDFNRAAEQVSSPSEWVQFGRTFADHAVPGSHPEWGDGTLVLWPSDAHFLAATKR